MLLHITEKLTEASAPACTHRCTRARGTHTHTHQHHRRHITPRTLHPPPYPPFFWMKKILTCTHTTKNNPNVYHKVQNAIINLKEVDNRTILYSLVSQFQRITKLAHGGNRKTNNNNNSNNKTPNKQTARS